jgi:pimeloyl-ACP methyl ester carboxylesterase
VEELQPAPAGARGGILVCVRRLAGFIAGCAAALLVLAAPALAQPSYAPLDQPGPPLSVPIAKLKAALQCEPGVTHAKVEPVLLNPATGVTAEQNYSWNWEPALDKLGIPWCTYTAPHSTLDNIETSGEYLVYAIRTMHALADRRIAIMGHSQGGMSMRWALRFWPDTRPMVDDVIGFSGSNHGTTVLSPSLCAAGCPPADWQQLAAANFIGALNSRAETFPGISYTEVYTHTDEVVQPNSGANASAALHTGGGAITNVATQDVCPSDVYEHLEIGTVDPVAYALAIDALTHAGPADVARIPKSVCSQVVMPGINPANAQTILQVLAALPGLGSVTVGPLAGATTGAPVVKAEPPLQCYVFAACAGAAAPKLQIRVSSRPRRLRAGQRTRLRVLVRVREGSQLVPVPGVVVSFAGRHSRSNAKGVASLGIRPRRARRYRLSASRAGCAAASRLLRVQR